jgi:hypothetical protein
MGMKTEPVQVPRPGIVDSIGAGLAQTRRRPWLMVIPIAIDLWLWLGPRVSIEPLLQRFMLAWESLLRTAYTPAQLANLDQALGTMREAAVQIGAEVNLADGVTGGWLGAPSVLATSQVTRMTFISDLVLAPAGLSLQLPHIAAAPFRGNPIVIGSLGSLVLTMFGFWLVGQMLVTLWFYLGGLGRRPPGAQTPAVDGPVTSDQVSTGRRGLPALFFRIAVFSIVIGAIIMLLRLPLAFAITMLMLSSNSVLGLVSLLFGGVALWLTLWFLLALFFVSEGLLLEGHPLGRSVSLSIGLVHRNFAAAIGLAALINLLVYSFRIVWDLLGQTPLGVGIAIVANAYLVTSLLLATFAFFEGLRRATVTQRAKATN